MNDHDCTTLKRLGDSVNPPPGSTWNKYREKIMQDALLAKFTQHNNIREKLKQTGNATLVEATRDRFWGAGAELYSNEVKTSTWSGLNKLGLLPMEVRSNL